VDRAGETLGRVDDLIVRLGDGGYPPVTGLQGRIGSRQVFVPINDVAQLTPMHAQLAGRTVNLGRFERREGEVLLRQDILEHKLINLETGRLVRASDIALAAHLDDAWRVVGIDTSPRNLFQRVFHRSSNDPIDPRTLVDWTRIEPFVSHVPTARLRLPLLRLRRLHPAQIADLVEAASHEEGEEILQAVAADKELEADVFEELDDEHQVEFLRERSDQEAAAVLARMEPDDAADLLLELDQERRLPVLNLLPAVTQRKIRTLLGYNPSTAGGLMNPDFFSAPAAARMGETLARIRSSELEPEQLLTIWVLDETGGLAGAVLLAELVSAPEDEQLSSLIETPLPTVTAETDLPDLALLMTDYDLMGMPVVDEHGKPVGVVSVDDVLERLLPEEWRRRAGAARG